MAHQQQHAAPGRLFQHLEERIRSRGVEFVDRIDDGDPPAALPGRRAEERDRAAHVIDTDVLVQLAGLFVDHPLEHEQIAMRLRRDAPRHRMVGVDVKRCRVVHQRRARIGMGEDEARQAISKRRLADAGWAPDQPGVREASAPVGFEQYGLRLGVTVKDGGFPWRPRLDIAGFVVGCAHDAAPAGNAEALAELSRSLTVFQTRSATADFVSVASITTQRAGSLSASRR